MTRKMELMERILERRARVGVIGLGYVGLPLAVEFARSGFAVTGFEVSAEKVATINGVDSKAVRIGLFTPSLTSPVNPISLERCLWACSSPRSRTRADCPTSCHR